MSTLQTTIEEQRGTPLAELETLLRELGHLAGCTGQFVPNLSFDETGLTIRLDGPEATIFLRATTKEATDEQDAEAGA